MSNVGMYLLYVDESGDGGLVNSPTTHFALSGLVIHESRWRDFTNQIAAFRKTLRVAYGLPLRSEIHASQFIKSPPTPGMQRHIRLAILRNFIDELAKLDFISITSVIVTRHPNNQATTYLPMHGKRSSNDSKTRFRTETFRALIAPISGWSSRTQPTAESCSGWCGAWPFITRCPTCDGQVPAIAICPCCESSRIHIPRIRGTATSFRCAILPHISCFRSTRQTVSFGDPRHTTISTGFRPS
jgi:hypothetical protein